MTLVVGSLEFGLQWNLPPAFPQVLDDKNEFKYMLRQHLVITLMYLQRYKLLQRYIGCHNQTATNFSLNRENK